MMNELIGIYTSDNSNSPYQSFNYLVKIVEDNEYGIIIKLSNNPPYKVDSHEAFVMIFRDRKGNIVSIDIEYKGTDDASDN
ncbi:hypothetical protein V6M85_12470 [Sulfolobus tengchongensis]|uniref:Uncharacterized protein n=1 Tax=Sulfolobus tengchongensis TaxID=207809 RepID=A0AAX4L052_9CREN